MGLFDTVICDYPLPLPDFTDEEFEDINSSDKGVSSFQEVEWQTKDMGNMLDVYSIEDDGQIYLRATQWYENEDAVTPQEGDLEKYERTAEINFYQMFMGKEWDHWLEFKATVWKGELKELELVEYKKEDNSDRVEMQEQMMEQVKGKTSRGKLYKAYRYIVSTPLHVIRVVLGFMIGATMKIERWLT